MYVNGVGLLGPGLDGWPDSRACLAGRAVYTDQHTPEPSAGLLPPNERRRSSEVVRWALHVADEAVSHAAVDPRSLLSVFASSGGETEILDRICASLASVERSVSPTLFHHSVHNAAAGYWCIATGNQHSSTSLACYDASFAAGLLEAAATLQCEAQPVLLVAYDVMPPPPLYPARPLVANFAVALVLATEPGADCNARLSIGLVNAEGRSATTMQNSALEKLRRGNPAAHALPLLAAIAQQTPGRVELNYLEDQRLTIAVQPCAV